MPYVIGLSSIVAAHAAPLPGQGTWQTTLQARDIDHDGTVDAYFDTSLNITWFRQAFFGRPSTVTNNILGLNFSGYDGWRLPKNDLSCGYRELDCLGNEMAYLLWNELGGSAGVNLYNSGDFLDFSHSYYLEDRSSADEYGYWAQNFYGDSVMVGNTFGLYAFAVRDGDIAAVPEPSSTALL